MATVTTTTFEIGIGAEAYRSQPHVSAIPGDGFVVSWEAGDAGEEGPDPGSYLSFYSGDVEAAGGPFPVGEDAAIADIAATRGATGVLWHEGVGSVLQFQAVDVEGEPVADAIPVAPVQGNLFDADLAQISAFPDGLFALVWRTTDGEGVQHEVLQVRSALGDSLRGPAHLFVPRPNAASADLLSGSTSGSELVVVGEDAGGTAIWRITGSVGAPAYVRVPGPPPGDLFDGPPFYNFSDATKLATGDILVSWVNLDPERAIEGNWTWTDFQRFDANGSALGAMVSTDKAAGETGYAIGSPMLAPLQDGGYVIAWESAYRIYDRHDVAVTEAVDFGGARITDIDVLDDGRFVLVTQEPGAEGMALEGHVIDYAASHDAQWGGKQVVIHTWQEQELLTRADATEMLRSNAGVAMKPWILNFEAASDADGINATANSLANHLLGGNGANVFIAGAGNDKIYGLGGNDWGLGEAGNDLIDGGDGHDVLIGGLGNDSVAGGEGADTLAGDQGDDAMEGQGGNDIVHGGEGDDLLGGNAGADTVYGGAGDDGLSGGAGDDILSGDRGADSLQGGSGADHFRFGTASGQDTIGDFEYGAAGDRIVVDLAGDGMLNGVVVDSADSLFDTAEDTADGVLIDLGDDNTILLVGWDKADLGADMFLLV
ncbi:MAG: calcium-binding protein [Alphaproteobacteria bacterium]